MIRDDRPKRSAFSFAGWLSLTALFFALASLLLVGARLVQADPPPEAPLLASSGSDDWTQTRYTVSLPIVFKPWTSRGLIAFERQLENGNHDIFLMDNDGSKVQNLTNDPDADDGAPTWAPDGRFIAFSSDRVGNSHRAIYKINVQTGELTQLTSGDDIDRWPTWSPDGDRIAFARDSVGYPPDIYVMDSDGANIQQLTTNLYADDFPAWSPDGQWIVYSSINLYEGLARGGYDLWRMHPDGSEQQVVLRTDRPQPPNGHDRDRRDEIYPSWSPEGRLYYTYKYRDYPADKTEYLHRIWPDGSGREKVFNDEYNRWIASFAPDGECFVFYSYMGGGDKEVWKWCKGYSDALNLTDNSGISDEFCAWSPVP